MLRGNLYLLIVATLFCAQCLSIFAPVNAMPLAVPQPQAPQTITLNGTASAYAINDPTTIDLAGADIYVDDGSGAPPGHVQSQADGSWTFTGNTTQPTVDFTVRFAPPAGYELPPGTADMITVNGGPAAYSHPHNDHGR
jgi:hypothetical protein